MSREYYRPYTKVFSLEQTDVRTEVDLRDTGGNLLRANYVTVTSVSGGGDAGIFNVIVSGLNLTTSAPHQSLAINMAGDPSGASGICGLVASQNGGSVVISLAPHESTSRILVSQSTAGITTYAVSYGIVTEANSRADNVLHNAGGGFNGVGT